jgi:chromosome segregation ATPase
MNIKLRYILSAIAFSFVSVSLQAQSIFPGKQTIDKTEYLGLTLNQNIPDKQINNYWKSYIEKYGKVKNKKSVYTISKASIPSISNSPIDITSEVTSKKEQSQVFLALNVDGQYITNYTDQTYQKAEAILKEFSEYASKQEEVRVADESFSSSEKSYQKLQKENENLVKDIEKTEKKITELRSELEKKRAEADNALIDLQNKQKALELVKTRNTGN